MTVSSLEITAGSGTHIHTNSRSISSVTRHDQYIQQGEGAYPTYRATAAGISIATSADHIMQIMADGTNYTRLKWFEIMPTDDVPASATVAFITVLRLTTAGTGGTNLGSSGHDSADTYAGGVMSLPTAKGTEGSTLWHFRLPLQSAHPFQSLYRWEARYDTKPVIFGTGTAAGIAWKIQTGIASCTVQLNAEFSVTSFL